MAMSSLACISTELDATTPFPVCSSLDSGGGVDAVVYLVTERSGSTMYCSGIAIAPRLVLTALGCVLEANDPLQSESVEHIEPIEEVLARDLNNAGVADYSTICAEDDSWALRERGNFEGRPGDRVSPAALEVFRFPPGADLFDPDAYQVVKASKVFTSRSASRCRDDIAVLQLEEPLAGEAVTLWLGAGGAVGEAVRLGNFCSDPGGLPVLEETPSEVLAITLDAAQPLLPPRSLLLTAELASTAPGGAVFLAPSSALVGMIVSGTAGALCSAQTNEGTTFAAHLASYRGLLFDAAHAAGEVLRLDPAANDPYLENAVACPAP